MTLRTFNDPILSQPCEPMVLGDDLAFLDDMREACERHNGVGLAAPQIGVAKRAVYIWPQRKGGESLFMLNPEIVHRGKPTAVESEGCLSYPGVWAPVERHLLVHVRYQDLAFQEHTRPFVFYAARVVQHEIDHTLGVCKVGDYWRKHPPKPSRTNASAMVLAAVALLAGGSQ